MSTPAPTPNTPPKPRRRLWRRRLAGFLVLLASAAWLAPVVIARTGLRDRVAREALAGLRGEVAVGGASLGWFSPVELRGVVVTDAEGRTLLTAPKVTSSKTLFALLRDRSDLGEFTVDQPAVEVVCEKGSTNLEDALATFLKDGTPAGPTRPALAVRVSGGKLTVHDAGKVTVLEDVDAVVAVPGSRSEPVAVKLSAVASAGKLDADLSLGESGTAKVVTAAFPLAALAPLLRRVEPSAGVSGGLTANLTATWGKSRLALDGTATVKDLDVAGPWLRGDRLRLASADLSPVKLEAAGNGVRVERAELRCDVGSVSAAGAFDPDEPADKLLDRAGLKVEADVDLAKLASLLPRLLRVREGTAIREGKLSVRLASRTTPDGTAWDGEVRTSALKAERDGKPVEWAEPLAVEFTGRVPPGRLPTFDKLVCRSDFLAVNAAGSAESFRAAANVYLDRLSARLGDFVDLGGTRLGGEASAWVIASRSPQGPFKADAGLELKGFVLADGAGHGLREPLLQLRASASGQWPANGSVRVDAASAALTAGADAIEVKLLEPVRDARQLTGGKLSAKLTGDLGRWMGRVRGFVRVPPYLFGGTVTASGTVRLDRDRPTVDRLLVSVEKARFRGAGLDLDEPYVNAAADMALTRSTGSVEFTNFQITSLVLSVTEGRLAFEVPPDGNLAVSGGGKAATDLNRLGRTLKLQTDPKGTDALHGRGTGPIRFRWQGDTTTFGGTLDVIEFASGLREKPDWSEPTLKLDLDARYDETPDRLTMHRGRLERPGLAVDAKGTWSKFDTTQDVALDGTLAYDLAKLTPRLREAIGGGFQASGQGSKPFSITGSLAPVGPARPAGAGTPAGPPANPFAKLTADAGLGWDSAKVYGFDLGPGELRARLAGGVATISPVRASFGGGQITLAPTVRLDPVPSELSFAKGKLVDRAKLTPAACAGALGYALPLTANAAQAEGEVSVVLDDNRIPLADFTKATARGQVLVHKAAVGAGPVMTEIAKLLGAPGASVVLANEMTVPVRVEGGRVHHENLTVTVNGFAVRTAGSVGFDGSLALVADVPVPAGLLKNNPQLMKAMAGKTVKVPVTGTVSKPAIDPRLFQAAVATLARDAAKDAGRDLLNKELDRLFPAMPAPPKK